MMLKLDNRLGVRSDESVPSVGLNSFRRSQMSKYYKQNQLPRADCCR